MTKKRLGIEVDVSSKGDGFKKLSKDARELNETFEDTRKELKQLNRVTEVSEHVGNDFRRELEKSIASFEGSRRVSIRLRAEYKRLARSGEASQAELEGLSRQIDAVQDVQLKNINSTRELIQQYNRANGQVHEFSEVFKDLRLRLQDAEGYINGVTNKVRTMGRGFEQVDGSIKETNHELKDLNQTAIRSEKELGNLSRKVGPGMVAMGNLIAEGLEEAAQAALEFGKESVQAFYDFDRGAREIFTLLPGASAKMREDMKRDVLALGTELGRLPEEMLPAVYDAISAGIPEDNVLDTVAVASDAARAGVSDLSSTLKLGVAILNAQVAGVSDINDVYDQLFFTVKNGVVTMPELTDVMSQVTSIAGEAGVSMQDISAAMIVMTRQGDSAAEAAELLSTMLTQLSTSGTTMATTFEQAAGKSFRQFVAEGNTLADAMQLLQAHADHTGQSLGDMLGGGSPFFRDTQAARGALELTGKHLESLTQFSNEAHDAMGSMATASAEMGQAAEQSALEATAAWEEFKISVGQASAQAFEPLIRDATEVVKVMSGNYENGVSRQIDELIESGLSYEQVAGRVVKVFNEQNNITGRVTGGYKAVNEQVKRLAAVTGDYSQGSKELEASLQAVFGEQLQVIDGYIYLNGQWVESIDNLAEMNALHQETGEVLPVEQIKDYAAAAESSDRVLIGLTSTVQVNADVQDVLNEKMDRSAKLRLAEADATQNQTFFLHELIAVKTAEAEATQKRVEAAEAERAKIEEIQLAYSNYAIGASEAEFATTNWTNELFEASAQMGLTQGQIVLMAAATGEYSDEQVEAMLKTAAMKVAVDQLAQGLANGEITTQQAIDSIRDFEAQLDKNYKLEFDYDDLKNAEASAAAARDAFLRAEGNYKATFTTHNVTINEVIEKKNKSGGESSSSPSSKDGAKSNHLGGAFRAGELMLVGDGPGGKFIPGISEYVAFDKPGTVIGAAESARLHQMKNQSLPPGIGGSGSVAVPFNEFAPQTTPKQQPNINIQVIVYAQEGQSITEVTEDSMLEAARKAGLF